MKAGVYYYDTNSSISYFSEAGIWSMAEATETEKCGGRRVFVIITDTSGTESRYRRDSGGVAKRRDRRIECVAKFCDEGGDLSMRYQGKYNFHYNLAKN